MGTEAEVKHALKEGIGTILYGVMAIHDWEPYEIMDLLKEIMNEVKSLKDFFAE